MERPNAQQPPTCPIELWTWPLEWSASEIAVASAHLSEPEATRAARFIRARDRDRFIAGRARLREILGEYLGQPPASVDIRVDDDNKPYVPLRAGGLPLHFNLAHSQGFAVLAVSRELPVGVDVELIRPISEGITRFFSDSEQAALAALAPEDWPRGFFQCWTRKEAFVKALGRGLLIPLKDFDVTLAPGEPPLVLRYMADPDAPRRWALRHLEFGAGFIGALAIPAENRRLELISRSCSPPIDMP